MHEIELGRLREGEFFEVAFPSRVHRFEKREGGLVVVRLIYPDSTVVLIDDATMERVKEREAKNAGQ